MMVWNRRKKGNLLCLSTVILDEASDTEICWVTQMIRVDKHGRFDELLIADEIRRERKYDAHT